MGPVRMIVLALTAGSAVPTAVLRVASYPTSTNLLCWALGHCSSAAQGVTVAEDRDGDLYFSCTLPNLIVGSVGNGKSLDFVEENLARLGCREKRETGDNARRLAVIAASTVLCGELSLMAAQTNRGELMRAHLQLERQPSQYCLSHSVLAQQHGVDQKKYHVGIGQDSMSVAAGDEDIVTLGAAAARPIIDTHGTDDIRTLVLATETGIDQSKAAGIYVHSLLGLPTATRVVEMKQACYGATAALQFALATVSRDPTERVLVIASDIARYDLDSPGEATQGAAAVAMLVTSDPAILAIDRPSGLHTADIMDFWRPNYRATALVDGKLSIEAYLQAVEGAWKDYTEQGGLGVEAFAAYCYHQPFTKMAFNAHRHLLAYTGCDTDDEAVHRGIAHTTTYNRLIGNSYTASLYLGLASLLDHAEDLTDLSIALFSYGSGSVAEFFRATVVPGYRSHLRSDANRAAIARRVPIDYRHYRALQQQSLPTDGGDYILPTETAGPYRLAAMTEHKRIYDR